MTAYLQNDPTVVAIAMTCRIRAEPDRGLSYGCRPTQNEREWLPGLKNAILYGRASHPYAVRFSPGTPAGRTFTRTIAISWCFRHCGGTARSSIRNTKPMPPGSFVCTTAARSTTTAP